MDMDMDMDTRNMRNYGRVSGFLCVSVTNVIKIKISHYISQKLKFSYDLCSHKHNNKVCGVGTIV